MPRLAVLVAAVVLVAGCSDPNPSPSAFVDVPVFAQGPSGGNFGTPLSAGEEVMPAGVVNESRAVGNAIFRLNDAGDELYYKLIVANIENAFMAHIHRAPAGVNGGIVVWLFPSTTPDVRGPAGAGRQQGVLAEGVIRAADLVGSLRGAVLSDLLGLIVNGGAYVNVHTSDGNPATSNIPGDFAGGEIRGQIETRGHH